jgi:hypothetical protein
MAQDGLLGEEFEMITIDRLPLAKNITASNTTYRDHSKAVNYPRYNQDSCIKVKVFENDHLKELETSRTITQQQVDMRA